MENSTNGASEIRSRLNQEAQDQLTAVNAPQRRNGSSALWAIIFSLALIALAGSLYGLYHKVDRLEALIVAARSNGSPASSLAQPQTASSTNRHFQTGGLDAASFEAGQVAQPGTGQEMVPGSIPAAALAPAGSPPGSVSSLYLPFINTSYRACRDLEAAALEIVSGPHLTPDVGTTYDEDNPPTVQASWVVRNTGDCTWENLELWSLNQGQARQPTLYAVAPAQRAQAVRVVFPNQIVEVILTLDAGEAHSLEEEWALKLGNLTLLSHPHLTAQVGEWMVLLGGEQSTSKATRSERQAAAASYSFAARNRSAPPPTAPPPQTAPAPPTMRP